MRGLTVICGLMLALLSGCSGSCSGNANNSPPNNGGKGNTSACGPDYEVVPLDTLPTLDPPYLWPDNNARSASDTCWVTWRVGERSQSRLLLSNDGKRWHEFGNSFAVVHDRQVDLARWHSQVMYSVEFDDQGTRYRSRPRLLSFGKGARWDPPLVQLKLQRKPDQRHDLHLVGVDPLSLPGDCYVFAMLPDEVKLACSPQRGDDSGGAVTLIVDGTTVPDAGLVCYLQVRDPRAETVDRVKLVIEAR